MARWLGKAFGAALGFSAYKRLQNHPGFHGAVQNYYSVLSSVPTRSPSEFKVENVFLVSLFLAVNLCKWAIFGELSQSEIHSLRLRVSYTVWEFCFGFLIFYYKCFEFDVTLIRHELYKFAGLFLCILLLRGFHYLAQERVTTLFDHPRRAGKVRYLALRFGVGLVLLNMIDVMLVYRFYRDITSEKDISFQDNILISIFGFEILQILPLILATSVKFAVNYYGYRRGLLEDDHWQAKFTITHVVDFVVSLVRFSMVCVFSIVFLYFYTFPFHIMPSSYATLRLLVSITRDIVTYKKRQMILSRLTSPKIRNSGERCVICYCDMEASHDVREFNGCGHSFHRACLQSWFQYSESCPVCRGS